MNILKKEYRDKTTYYVDKTFKTCHTKAQFSSGVSLSRNILEFRSAEQCESLMREIINSEPFYYKGHRIQKLFFTDMWKMVYVDLSWRHKDYASSKQYVFTSSFETLKNDIDRKEDKPKTSVFKKIFNL